MEGEKESFLMLLFSKNITNRLRYVSGFIGRQITNAPLLLTSDPLEFQNYQGVRINYSDDMTDEKAFRLSPHSLLFEQDVRPQQIECFDYNKHKAFFRTKGDFEFDVFAAVFYLISRYEEYLPHRKDDYGRYDHTESLAFKEHFLHLPLVNLWLEDFKAAINRVYPEMIFHRHNFKYIPTYDIDIAWSYRYKGFVRNFGGAVRSIMGNDWSGFKERIAVLRKKRKDPFDSYEWLDALHLYCGLRPYYFFLLAERGSKYDKNIPPSKKAMQELIAYHSEKGTVGIHPSWQSTDDPRLLKQEIGWLEFITGNSIKHSRQHFIRLTLPETYRRLIGAGIERDFSMGYGTTNGFRASVASSFNWFDLEKDEATDLVIFPFCFMDANSFYEQKLVPHQALAEMMRYYQCVRQVNGMMITIWHNNFLGTAPMFKGWREAYEIFLKEEVYWDR
ncbi:MAG TPA: polysaccharide deacetylase family protein [Chitinophagaceae bacterium]